MSIAVISGVGAGEAVGSSGLVGAAEAAVDPPTITWGTPATNAAVEIPPCEIGDVLVAIMGTQNTNASTTPPAGWTTLQNTGSGVSRDGMWYRISDGTEGGTSVLFSFSGTEDVVVGVITGLDVDNLNASSDHSAAVGTSPLPIAGHTPVEAPALVLITAGGTGAGGTGTAGAWPSDPTLPAGMVQEINTGIGSASSIVCCWSGLVDTADAIASQTLTCPEWSSFRSGTIASFRTLAPAPAPEPEPEDTYQGLLESQGATSMWALDTARADTETEPDLIGSVDMVMTGGGTVSASTPPMEKVTAGVSLVDSDTEVYQAGNSYDPDSDWSVSGWVNLGAADTDVLWQWAEISANQYLWLLHRDDHGGLTIQIGDGTSAVYLDFNVDLSGDGKWHHVAVTRNYDADGALDTLTCYLDGVQVAQGTRNSISFADLDAGSWALGNRSSNDIGVNADLAAWAFAEGVTWTADEVWRQYGYGMASFPLDVPIPKSWLDAPLEQGYADGNSIATLKDHSPVAADFTTIATYAHATWETDALDGATIGYRFDGANTGTEQASGDLVTALAAGSAAEMFAVMKLDSETPTGSGGWWQICGFTTPSNHYTFGDANTYDGTFSTARKGPMSGPAANHILTNKHVVNIRSGAGAYSFHVDGVQEYTTATNTFSVSGTARLGRCIASGSPGDNHRGDGDLAAQIIFGAVLSTDERAAFSTWLNTRFGASL